MQGGVTSALLNAVVAEKLPGPGTGSVVLGAIGSEKRADFTAIGRDVNYAARLSGAAAPGEVLISSATFYRVEGRAKVAGPELMRFKQMHDDHQVYRLLGLLAAPAAQDRPQVP